MPSFRYADQERVNIAASETRARQQAALNASLAQRKAAELDAEITKTSLGLGNVDNTSDASKPVSTAQQTALDLKANAADVTTSLAGKLNTWVAAPATPASTGTAGQIAYDGTQFYVCVATNTWVRTALATW